jgi:nucleoside 2-deoxyribosyltransferase
MKIYLAGKIDRDDWRRHIVDGMYPPGMRGNCSDDEEVMDMPAAFPVLPRSIFGEHDYVGPYFMRCRHGKCFLDEDSHGFGNERFNYKYMDCHGRGLSDDGREVAVVSLCLKAIDAADLVFAWVDSLDAYGTVVELGYARKAGKRIWLAANRFYRDMWFVFRMAQRRVVADSPRDALKHFLEGEARFITYAEYLQTAHWRGVRGEALDRAGHCCQVCKAGSVILHAHHNNYECLWAESESDLIVLCVSCHKNFHTKGKLTQPVRVEVPAGVDA